MAAAKQHLADCVEIALSTDNLAYEQAEDRAELLRFYRFMEEVLEAAYLLTLASIDDITALKTNF